MVEVENRGFSRRSGATRFNAHLLRRLKPPVPKADAPRANVRGMDPWNKGPFSSDCDPDEPRYLHPLAEFLRCGGDEVADAPRLVFNELLFE